MSNTVAQTESSKSPQRKKPQLNTYPFWSPRFWHGMRTRAFWSLMARGRFRVHPIRAGMAFILVFCALVNSFLYRLQCLFYGRKIAETSLEHPPIFIIGHWRSGTTHLHELMVRDDRFAFPTTYECFAPYHFLVSGWIMPKLLWFLLPTKRPMDNMAAGFDRPQEDEFALCAMGAPTPYYRMAFPNNQPPPYHEFLNMEDVAPRDRQRFGDALRYFVKALTVAKKKQLIMKSPPHTGRVEVLAELFPGAKFIHISRDPYSIFPSTVRLWQALDVAQAFQIPRHEHLEEYVFDCFEQMYRGFDKQREKLDPAHLCDIRYEDLVRDPIGQIQRLYEQLDLGDFQPLRPKLEQYVEQQKDYRPNLHELDPEIKAEIDRRWAGYMVRYGYGSDE